MAGAPQLDLLVKLAQQLTETANRLLAERAKEAQRWALQKERMRAVIISYQQEVAGLRGELKDKEAVNVERDIR